jgi:alkylation response protein AidB-like acyl-CoA dehydrogenase
MGKGCKIAIFTGLTDAEGPYHKRQSMVLVPLDTPGVKVMRALKLF